MRDKLLGLLKNDFISGESLAKSLGISRTAVWKQVKSLEKLGYEIESVKNKGYRLISRPDTTIPEEISVDLSTKIIGKEIHYFEKIPSTNQFAKELTNKSVKDGTIVVSDVQTQGRGRKDRTWFSPKGGLWFSVVIYPNIQPRKSMMLTMAASLAVVDGIKTITGIVPRIKWPNDVLIKGKKVCGILTEIDAEPDRINFAIIGIGLNVNNILKSDLEKHATTLKIESGSNVYRVKLLRSILKSFDKSYENIKEGRYDDIRKSWQSYSQLIGKSVRICEGEITLEGTINDVDEDGALILKNDERTYRILSGDLEVLS